MKIGYESTTLWKPNRTGVDVYSTELVRALIPLLDPKRDTIYLSYFSLPHRPSVNLKTKSGHYRDRRIWYFPLKIYNQFYKYLIAPPFDLLAWGAFADVYIFPNYFRWPVMSKRSIVVIHDLTFKTHPEYLTKKSAWSLLHGVPKSMAKSQAVIAVSEYTKRDIIEQYDVDPDKVHVIPNAIDPEIFFPRPEREIATSKAKFGIRGEYIFFMSTLEPRKNLVGLLRAYRAMPKTVKDRYALVLSGGKGWLDGEILSLIKQLQDAGDQVIQTGYLPEEDLPILHSGASLHVLASFYEGFGISMVQAMACGTPVVTCDNSSLPEVVGDAGLIVETGNDEALSAAMAKVLTDPKLAERLREKGLERVKRYTWDESAKKLLGLIRQVVNDEPMPRSN